MRVQWRETGLATTMRVLIKRSPAAFTMRAGGAGGPLRRAAAFALFCGAGCCVAVCVWLWAAALGAVAEAPLTGLAARWHLWLGAALAAGLAGAAARGRSQRPT